MTPPLDFSRGEHGVRRESGRRPSRLSAFDVADTSVESWLGHGTRGLPREAHIFSTYMESTTKKTLFTSLQGTKKISPNFQRK